MPAFATTHAAVLENRREDLQVGEARLLHVHARGRERRGEAPAPRSVARMRPEEQGHPSAARLLPPADEPLHEAILEGRVRRRVPHDDDERKCRIEPVRDDEAVEFLPSSRARVDVRLRPAGDHDPLRRDVVIADEIVSHRGVLDDVDVAERRDDALADGVVPARDVRDERNAEAPRADEKGHDDLRLDVREDERGAVPAQRPAERARHVAGARDCHRLIARSNHLQRGSGPARDGVEHPVLVTGGHALAVESVPQVQPDRERVVAEHAIECAVDAPVDPLEAGDTLGTSASPSRTGASTAAAQPAPSPTTRAQPAVQARAQPATIPVSTKSRVESGSGSTTSFELIAAPARHPDGDPSRHRAPSSSWSAQRLHAACRTLASPRRRRPTTSRPGCAPQPVGEAADGRVVLEDEERRVGAERVVEPGPVEAVQPRHVHDREADPRARVARPR